MPESHGTPSEGRGFFALVAFVRPFAADQAISSHLTLRRQQYTAQGLDVTMTEVEFQAGDELDGDLENEGFAGDAGGADENADATAVRKPHARKWHREKAP